MVEPVFEISCGILTHDELDNHWYRLRLSSPTAFFRKFTPGMFVMIKTTSIGNDPFLRRPFSIAYISRENRWFDIIYRVTGRGTLSLSHKKPGEHLNLIGPLGKGFKIPGDLSQLYLVAGGIGIAPLLSLSQALRDSKGGGQLFLWGIRSKEHFIDFKKIYPALTPFTLKVSSDDGSVGQKGNVTNLLFDALEEKMTKDLVVFACGPIKMLSAIHHKRRTRHSFTLYVSVESRMACGQGYCMGCAVPSTKAAEKYLKVCKDGPVFNANHIDWSKIENATG